MGDSTTEVGRGLGPIVRNAAVAAVLLMALAAPLGPLAGNRFHHDEALYSSWGLDIASGRDVMVSGSPVDKPPLSLYVQAVCFLVFGVSEASARIPSLLSHVVGVWLLFLVGRALFDEKTGWLAALFVAASPFAILFASTAFTDSMMVLCVLAGCLLAVRRRWSWAGVTMGLAAITKQQGAFFVPLALGLAWAHGGFQESASESGRTWRMWMRFLLGWLLVMAVAAVWDVSRGRQPGFMAQSLLSYGGLHVTPWTVGERLAGFVTLLQFTTGSAILNWVLVVGGVSLVIADAALLATANNRGIPWNDRMEHDGGTPWVDPVMAAFCCVFVLFHAVLSFQVWDRYLLGLVPCLALVLARVLVVAWRLVARLAETALARFPSCGSWTRAAGMVFKTVAVALLLVVLAGPVQDAANSRYPIGGDHGAFEGIDQVVAYLRTVPADTTLYHHWLGGHWRFYLWSNPYDFRYWRNGADLARQAADRPGADRYIVFPSWESPTPARLALEARGLSLREVHRALRGDGSVSFRVYRIEETR